MSFEGGGRTEEKKEEKEKEEKFVLCESIGHRPLRGRCPKSIPRHYGSDVLNMGNLAI